LCPAAAPVAKQRNGLTRPAGFQPRFSRATYREAIAPNDRSPEMKNPVRNCTFALIAATSLFADVAHADGDDHAKSAAIAKSLGFISIEQATEKALAAKPGVVVEAELDDRDFGKGWDYEFEIVDADGREWDVKVDAKTGEVRRVWRDWF
jgi:uncharacterized membrane protein YkoI